jgi:hypothetical protein
MPRALTVTERDSLNRLLKEQYENALERLTLENPDWDTRVEELTRKTSMGELKIEPLLKKLSVAEAAYEIAKEAAEKKRLAVVEIEEQIQLKMPMKDVCKTRRNRDRDFDEDESKVENHMSLCEVLDRKHPSNRLKVLLHHPIGKRALELEKTYQTAREALALCVSREQVEERRVLNIIKPV